MALDGIMIAALAAELRKKLCGGRLVRIVQPEKDALLLHVRNGEGTLRLLMSASAHLPLVYLTEVSLPGPAEAPGFLMLLRKYIGGGRITDIRQEGLERVLSLCIEHFDEMGDRQQYRLIAEMMGKHSNLILVDSADRILDSIRRVSSGVSSVREVLPSRPYFLPENIRREDSLSISEEDFLARVCTLPMTCAQALNRGLSGISPLMAQEFCERAGIDSACPMQGITDTEKVHLYHIFRTQIDEVKQEIFSPAIYRIDGGTSEYSAVPLCLYPGAEIIPFESPSELLSAFYSRKDADSRMKQKSYELRHITGTALDRARRKYGLQQKQLDDTEKRDRYRLWSDLIRTWGYGLEKGADHLNAPDPDDAGITVRVPLDPTLTPGENAVRYMEKYAKLKRTFDALSSQIKETEDEIAYLESVQNALFISEKEADLSPIRKELTDSGYIRRRPDDRTGKKGRNSRSAASSPWHYRSSDGCDIYVGRNNLQNDELTFHFASGKDWWFHAHGMPGSHVILKAPENGEELPDRAFNEAGALAAWYSAGRDAGKVEVDYCLRRIIKKPPAAKPGFVIYDSHYSLVAVADIDGLTLLEG